MLYPYSPNIDAASSIFGYISSCNTRSMIYQNTILILLFFLTTLTAINSQPLIIFDTDMGPDYDDVGALAVLQALEARGECTILATVASDAHPTIAPTIEVINTWYGRAEIPVGTAPENAPDFTAENNWNDSLIALFGPVLRKKQYPASVEVYRQVLAAQEDHSVTIVTVGFTSNLAALLASQADENSGLDGKELVSQKVIKWVAMAGGFPEGKEFNVHRDAVASWKVFREWPTPILFSGFEIGVKIKTGDRTAQMDASLNSPVQWAYDYNLRTYTQSGEKNRSSWDQTAVLAAVRDPEKYFYVNGPGKFVIKKDGSNTWDPETDNHHYFLVHKYPYQVIADVLEELMMYVPGRD